MRMLCWVCDKTRHDKIKNCNIKESIGLAPTVENIMENRLMWCMLEVIIQCSVES